jgi:glucose-6-phosphate 1-dehydrogenase
MSQSPEAYERLITDAMRGDATLFTRNDEVEAQWRIIDPVLETWAQDTPELDLYEAGSQGPDSATRIMLDGDTWRAI